MRKWKSCICKTISRIGARNQFLIPVLLGVFLLFPVFAALTMPAYACPHYDEYGDEYFWIFDEDGSSEAIYFKEHYERYIILDSDFNILHEKYLIPLVVPPDTNLFRTHTQLSVGNHDFWFDLPVRSLTPEGSSSIPPFLSTLIYELKIISINEDQHAEVFRSVNQAFMNDQMKHDKRRILDIQAKAAYEYSDSNTGKEVSTKAFSSPLKISFNLSAVHLSPQDRENLYGIYLKPIANGGYEPQILEGKLDHSGIFTFSTMHTGLHGIAVASKSVPANSSPVNGGTKAEEPRTDNQKPVTHSASKEEPEDEPQPEAFEPIQLDLPEAASNLDQAEDLSWPIIRTIENEIQLAGSSVPEPLTATVAAADNRTRPAILIIGTGIIAVIVILILQGKRKAT